MTKNTTGVIVVPAAKTEPVVAIAAIADIKRLREIAARHFQLCIASLETPRGVIAAVGRSCDISTSTASLIKLGRVSQTHIQAERVAYALGAFEPGRGELYLSEVFLADVGPRIDPSGYKMQPKAAYMKALRRIEEDGFSLKVVRRAMVRGLDWSWRNGRCQQPRLSTVVRVTHAIKKESSVIAADFLTNLIGREVNFD